MSYSYIKEAEYLGSYKVHCVFEDGVAGFLDLTGYLTRGGVFDKLKNETYARQLSLIDGVLSWGNGELDIAPETVYHLATQSPWPEWMKE